MLFNLVANVFSKMLVKAVNNGLIGGLLPHAIPSGVVSLQYVDDTILFIQDSVEYAKNLKWILTYFEKLSGLKINFHKSDLHTIHVYDAMSREFAQIFCCQFGEFPFKYLGVPLHFKKLRREDIYNLSLTGLLGTLLAG